VENFTVAKTKLLELGLKVRPASWAGSAPAAARLARLLAQLALQTRTLACP
jgi:hypothetical protein